MQSRIFFNAVIVEPPVLGDQGAEIPAQGRFVRTFAIVPWAALQRYVQYIIGDEMRPRAGAKQSAVGLICAAGPQGLRGRDAGRI